MGWFRKPASEPAARGDDGPVDGGWRELPVVEPAIGAMPLTMQTATFEAALPTRDATRWIEPLTHATSPAAPSGVIDGLVTVLAGRPPSVRDADPLELRTEARSSAPRPASPMPIVDAPVHEPASTFDEAVPAPDPPLAPALGAAAPLVVPAPPPLLLTTAPRPATLAPRPIHPVVSRAVEAAGPAPVDTPASAAFPASSAFPASPVFPAGGPFPAFPASPAGGGDADLAAPSPRTPFPPAPPLSESASSPPPEALAPTPVGVGPSAPSPAEVPEPPQRPPDPPLPPVAAPRRLGLGAPMTDRPRPADPPPSPSRAADAPLLGAAAPNVAPQLPAAPPDAERGSGSDGSALEGPTLDTRAPMPPSSAASASPLSPVRPTVVGPGPVPTVGVHAGPAGPVGSVAPARAQLAVAQRAPSGTGTAPAVSGVASPRETSVATLAARPLTRASMAAGPPSAHDRGSAAVAVDAVPAAPRRAVENLTGVALDGVVVHRSPDIATQAARLGARAYTAGGQVHIPAEHGSLTTGEGAALTAHELVHVAQQRVLGSSLPSEASPAGRRLEAAAQRAELPFRAPPPPAPPTPQPLVPATVAPGGADPALAALGAGIAQRAPDGSIVFDPPASDAEAPSPVDVSTVQAAPAEAAVHGEAHGAAGLDDNDKLEQLAKQLYDKIRDRLKAELRLDRERWGRVTDLSR